ncbi:MAG TPA: hypothetical protein VGB76_14745 [Pyrinomonadaceae bacterium]|jgi:hypothetical protein
MRIISQPEGKAKALASCALVVLVWGFFLVRAISVFAPDSVYVQPFNSDSALPVLMANDERIDAFRTYIYGQDQVGAWPSLICQLIKRATGHRWTPLQIHIMQATWLFLSFFLIVALTRSYFYLTGALFLLTLCLHPTVSHYFFVLNQRFAWQTTALFLGWWSLRRSCEYQFGVISWSRGKAVIRHLLSFGFTFLAAWTSPSSVPILCVFFALECVRARILSLRRGKASPRLAFANFAGALPLLAGFAAQRLLQANYHRFALRHFGQDYRTPVEFDWGYLRINLRHQLDNLFDAPWYALTLLGVCAAPFVAFQLLSYLRRRAPEEESLSGDEGVAANPRLDLEVLLLGSCAIAVINFVTSFIFSWMRLNAYGARYLALTYMFGTFAGLLALVWLVRIPKKFDAARRYAFPLLTLACFVLLALKFPPVQIEPTYRQMSEVAADLSRNAPPGTPLLGGYWDTYALASLQADATLVPVPAEDQLVRTPWTPLKMREAGQVLVVHHVFSSPGGAERVSAYTTFGDGQNPPAVIRQHGATLQLHTPRWYERHGYVFSLYKNQHAMGGH